MLHTHSAVEEAPVVRRASTAIMNPVHAALVIDRSIGVEACSMILLYCSGNYCLDAVAEKLAERRPGTQILGAVGSAVMGTGGYQRHGICAAGLPADMEIVTTRLEGVHAVDFARGLQTATWLKSEMHRLTGNAPTADDTFALLLVDGLTLCEERLVAAIAHGLENLHLVGGSAGDYFRGLAGRIWHAGRGHSDAAVLALIRPKRPFRAFSTHHFTPGSQRLLVTRADPKRRAVLELNGKPATHEYARAIGQAPDTLTPELLAANPPAVKVAGSYYVRSVRLVSTDPEEGLAFACAIDRGIVLRVTRPGDLLANLSDRLEAVAEYMGGITATLAFDCAMRHDKIETDGLRSAAETLLERFATCGMATYGEQFERMHLNQTFTGIAFGHDRT